MGQRFSPSSQAIVQGAQNIAQTLKNTDVSSSHLFLTLLSAADAGWELETLLLNVGVKRKEAQLYVEASLGPSDKFTLNAIPRLDESAKRAIQFAFKEARLAGLSLVEPEHLLLGCLHPQKNVVLPETLASLGWDLMTLRAKSCVVRKNAATLSQNPLELLTGNSQKAIEVAYVLMRSTWCGRVSTAHLLIGVLRDEHIIGLLEEIGISAQDLSADTRATIRSDSQLATFDKRFDRGAKRALDRAKQEAVSGGYKFIGSEHLLLGILPQRATWREILTWGTRVPDSASQVLSAVDQEALRQILDSRLSKSARKRNASANRYNENVGILLCMYIVGASLVDLLNRAGHSSSLHNAAGPLTTLFMLGGGVAGAGWLISATSRPQIKRAWGYAFVGFLTGATVDILKLHR